MPGGTKKLMKKFVLFCEAIAARVNNIPCCSYTSTGGAELYKNVVSQWYRTCGRYAIISEAQVLKHLGDLATKNYKLLLKSGIKGELESYLMKCQYL